MELISKFIVWLRSPYRKKIDELKSRYKELHELSEVAMDIGDADAYHSLQAEMKEVFFELFSFAIVEGIYALLPHVLIVWALSFRFNVIQVFEKEIGIYIWYPVCAITWYIAGKRLFKKILLIWRRRKHGYDTGKCVPDAR